MIACFIDMNAVATYSDTSVAVVVVVLCVSEWAASADDHIFFCRLASTPELKSTKVLDLQRYGAVASSQSDYFSHSNCL
jgi:phosphosulfolactate phosphohydrolase-like enzyme